MLILCNMLFLTPNYFEPDSWNDDVLIPHLHLTPDQGFILFIGLFTLSLVSYGLYLTLGSGKKDLRDPIDEHAKMHELGIAHGHGGNKDAYEMSGKLDHKHNS